MVQIATCSHAALTGPKTRSLQPQEDWGLESTGAVAIKNNRVNFVYLVGDVSRHVGNIELAISVEITDNRACA